MSTETIAAAEVVKQIGDLEAKYTGQMNEMKDALKAANDEKEGLGQSLESTKSEIADLVVKMEENALEITALQQKNAGLQEEQKEKAKSYGLKFAESEGLQAFAQKKSSVFHMEFNTKDVTSDGSGTEGANDAQHLFRPERKPGIFRDVMDTRLFVQDVMPTVTVSSDSVEYVVDISTDADIKAGKQTSQKDAKKESTLRFELRTAPICQLAHWICVARQALADASQLQGHIEGRLRYGLELEKENQLLLGDGVGGNINGLLNQAPAAATPPAGANKFDKVQKCLNELRVKFFMPDLVVMHPNDWCECVIAKTTGDGNYFSGSPFETPPALSMWGVQVVLSTLIPEDSVLVLDRMMTGQVMLRDTVELRASESHADFFVKNAIAMLIEQRVGLCVTNPNAMCLADIA